MEQEKLFGKPKWMFDSVFTSKYVNDSLNKNKESFLLEAPQLFQISKNTDKHCLITKNDAHIKYFTDTKQWVFEDITNLDAYNMYGIEYMETAAEKCYAIIPQ
jgi:hypothetical protein